jgi:hypothetical protein
MEIEFNCVPETIVNIWSKIIYDVLEIRLRRGLSLLLVTGEGTAGV